MKTRLIGKVKNVAVATAAIIPITTAWMYKALAGCDSAATDREGISCSPIGGSCAYDISAPDAIWCVASYPDYGCFSSGSSSNIVQAIEGGMCSDDGEGHGYCVGGWPYQSDTNTFNTYVTVNPCSGGPGGGG